MPKTVLKASLSVTGLHLPASFSRHAMDQPFLTQLCVWIDSQTLSLNKGEKGRNKEVLVEDKSRIWEVIPFIFFFISEWGDKVIEQSSICLRGHDVLLAVAVKMSC